jgi:two-component system, chemotaxis family, sensor kinase CheA
VVIAGVLVDRNVEQNSFAGIRGSLESQATMLAQMTASALFGELDPSDTSLSESVRALGNAVQTRLSVLTPRGVVVADSGVSVPGDRAPEADAPELVAARADGLGMAIRGRGEDERIYVARSIVRDGKLLGFARSSIPMEVVRTTVRGVQMRMAYGALVAIGVALVLGFVVSMGIVRPVRALAEGARAIGAGNYGHEIVVRSNDELGDLADSFNDMSRSLRRTVAQLDGRNQDMRVVLDNVEEGLLTLSLDGAMSAEKSAVVEKWFGATPVDKKFWDYIAPYDARMAKSFAMHWDQLVEGVLPIELCLDQMPKQFEDSKRAFALEYTPIFENDRLAKLLVVIVDVTEKVQAMRAEADQREILVVFERVMRDKNGFLEFLTEADELVGNAIGPVRPAREVLVRSLHTLKGNASVFGVTSVAEICHDLEDRLSQGEDDLPPSDRERLRARWMHFTERLRQLLGDRETHNIEVADDEYEMLLNAILNGLPRVEIAEMLADWKLERVEFRLERFAVQARLLAHRLDKGDVKVLVDANRLRLRRDVMAPFWGAFIHVIRNAVDHGLVKPNERGGVPGTLRLEARRAGDVVTIEVSDDGRGIDWVTVADLARRRGLPYQTREDLVAAIFTENFSTRGHVTSTSGRGVGLGAVRHACEALSGSMRVDSEPEKGTTVLFSFPASLVGRKPASRAPALSLPPPPEVGRRSGPPA